VEFIHYRLNRSSSPVLTATCLSYGSLCDFLTFFPQPTWRSRPSTDFDAEWLKRRGFTQGRAFWGKNRNFLKPLTPKPPKPPKSAQFWSGQKFRSISRLTLGSHEWTPLIIHRSPIKVSYLIGNVGWEIQICTRIFHRAYRSRDIAHAQWRFALDNGQAIWSQISRKRLEIGTWFQWSTNRKPHMGIESSRDRWRHVTLKGQDRDPNVFMAQYLENGWR